MLATLGIPALLAITTLTSQFAFANNIGGFDCYGETDCVDGWNIAMGQATQDYNYNLQMIKSFEIRPHLTSYQNTAYGIQIRYPSDWTIQESNASGTLINIAIFVSPTGPNSDPTAEVAIEMDTLHNSTTTLNNYAHFVAFTDYENNAYL